MKAPGFAAAMAAASAYEEVAVNCGPNIQCSYTMASYDAAAQPAGGDTVDAPAQQVTAAAAAGAGAVVTTDPEAAVL